MVLDVAEVLWEFLTFCREVRLLFDLKVKYLECPIECFFACSSRFLFMLWLVLREASVCFSSSNEKQARSRTSCCLARSVTLKNCLNQIHSHVVLVPRLLAVL